MVWSYSASLAGPETLGDLPGPYRPSGSLGDTLRLSTHTSYPFVSCLHLRKAFSAHQTPASVLGEHSVLTRPLLLS